MLYDRKRVLYAFHCYSGNCIYKCLFSIFLCILCLAVDFCVYRFSGWFSLSKVKLLNQKICLPKLKKSWYLSDWLFWTVFWILLVRPFTKNFHNIHMHMPTAHICTSKGSYMQANAQTIEWVINLWYVNLFSPCISALGANWCWSFPKHFKTRKLEKWIFWRSSGRTISQRLRKCCWSSQAIIDGLE